MKNQGAGGKKYEKGKETREEAKTQKEGIEETNERK